ncbi:MAG: hypothetical protein AAGI53_11310 [Planctomycetota bacterium]
MRRSLFRTLCGLAFALAQTAWSQTSVVLWSGQPLEGDIAGMSHGGLLVERDGLQSVVGWDAVRSVDGDLASPAQPFVAAGRLAWRARTRLERGDAFAAEPLLEPLMAEFAGHRGPTPALIAEGVLRCRLRRGALTSAIPAWLMLLDADRRADRSAPLIPSLNPVVDPQTGLVPALPPLWIDDAGVTAFAAQRVSLPSGDERAGVLAELYIASARLSTGLAIEDSLLTDAERRSADDPGLRLAWAVVASQLPAGRARDRALTELEQVIANSGVPDQEPAWTEAWARAALGSTLVRAIDPDTRRLGVIHLLHVPARFGAEASYLAGLCLARAAETVRDLGDARGADALEAELASEYSGHPALGRVVRPTPSPEGDPSS